MTYISTQSTIAALDAAGKLTRYAPRSRQPPRRRSYLTADAHGDLTNPHSACNLLLLRGFIEASLVRWTTGGLVYGGRKGGRFLARLDPPPPEIWEVRVTEPDVQVRLFGRFAEADTLILTKFHTRSSLGKYGSASWANAMTACQSAWARLFGPIAPLSAPTIHAYVTENCDDFPI